MTDFADPAFPLPEPEFLWVYDLIVHSQGASVTVGPGRRWRHQSASATFIGYIAAPDPRERERAARRDVVIDAVALAPRGTTVDEDDHFEAPAAPLTAGTYPVPSILVGRYDIESVRPNPSHVRILLTRIRGEDPPHAP